MTAPHQPDRITWADVVEAQETAEQAELYAHLSDLWARRYHHAVRAASATRARYAKQQADDAERQAGQDADSGDPHAIGAAG